MCFATDSLHFYIFNLCPLVLNWFLVLYREDCMLGLTNQNKTEASSVLQFHVPLFINDVLSLNNSMFGDCVDRIYHIELEIKENTDTAMSASYLDKSLKIPKW